MQDSRREIVGICGQWFGMLAVLIGLGIEICYKAHIGFVCITLGSLFWAIATKIRGK